ncbi:GNAT family N-acetyltransferase [Flavobacterium piscis]|uniref:GNAT superfamily N-acetyltransferase n=1 Tax=Flavobacterium piscis TaxID=1114874 RepID=A0ABU1Y569_9FLAO|nr:GNAT family N-acetyltransferase [Flavobacterium piscis]MDR7209308.1 GNAT superfamily N-acetyltransferase [Flavobacterium piscis]
MTLIKEISAEETFIVRQPVLRKGKPVESCIFEGDNLDTTHHFGLFENKNLTGIISLFTTSNPIFAEKKQTQIRGMAVLEEHRKKGFGEALVSYCETYCVSQDVQLIWFNARIEAVDFYKKMRYKTIGKPFDIKEVGEHFLMFKKI